MKNRIKRDDLNDSDIMPYSTMNADSAADEEEPAVLRSGGAIMAALEQKNVKDTEHSKPKAAEKKTKKVK